MPKNNKKMKNSKIIKKIHIPAKSIHLSYVLKTTIQ